MNISNYKREKYSNNSVINLSSPQQTLQSFSLNRLSLSYTSQKLFIAARQLLKSAFFLGLMLFLAATAGLAQSTQTHTVKPGDTLFGIADRYQLSVSQLRDWNNLSSDVLQPGQQLAVQNPSASPSNATIHTVADNETLYSISKSYGVSVDEIKAQNGLQNNALSVGQELRIAATGSSGSGAPTNRAAAQRTYTVKSGDSLYRIADQFNMSVDRLKNLNGLSSSVIQVGQQLAVQANDRPPSLVDSDVESSGQGRFIRYEVKQAQPLEQLLANFNMDAAEFKALNEGFTGGNVRTGQQLVMLAPANQSYRNPYQESSSLRTLGTYTAQAYEANGIQTTTSGELYNADALTAAHASIALGSIVFVRSTATNQGTFVRINDRTAGSQLLLSGAARALLGGAGQTAVTVYSANN